MPQLVTHSLETEEALIAGLLLVGVDGRALVEVADEDFFYDHLRPIFHAIRVLHAAGKPVNSITVMYALEQKLDSLSWKGDVGEVMLTDLLGRHVANPAINAPVAMANIVHNYAERRRGLQRAHEEGTRKYQEEIAKVDVSAERRRWWLTPSD